MLFRPHRVWAVLMFLAALVWALAVVVLLQLPGVPWHLVSGAGLFVGFFLVASWYYGRIAIWIDERGMVYRGAAKTRRLAFDDIRKVDVLANPMLTVYAVRGGDRPVHFTSLFRHHRRLVQLLLERAALSPLRS
jgi:hypothetical protein